MIQCCDDCCCVLMPAWVTSGGLGPVVSGLCIQTQVPTHNTEHMPVFTCYCTLPSQLLSQSLIYSATQTLMQIICWRHIVYIEIFCCQCLVSEAAAGQLCWRKYLVPSRKLPLLLLTTTAGIIWTISQRWETGKFSRHLNNSRYLMTPACLVSNVCLQARQGSKSIYLDIPAVTVLQI